MIPSLAELREAGALSVLDVHFARTVVRLAGTEDPLGLLAAALACRVVRYGHVCVNLERLAGTPVLSSDGERVGDRRWPELEAWLDALRTSPLVDDASVERPTRPLTLDSAGRLYLTRYWGYQRRLAERLRRRAEAPAEVVDVDALESGLKRLFPAGAECAASEDLRRAARMILERRLAIVSGGAGTGKTTLVVKVLALLVEQARAAGGRDPRIQLLAPTGKAAARLVEAVRKGGEAFDRSGFDPELAKAIPTQAATLHRALGADPRRPTRFAYGVDRPLPAEAVVVDEASMVDLALMTRLVEAVGDDARLILLGDRHQLASVEAGAILGDLCAAAELVPTKTAGPTPLADCVVQLHHSFRFDAQSAIGRLARAIQVGDADAVLGLLRRRSDDLTWLVPQTDGLLPAELQAIIEDGYGPYMRAGGPLERLARFDRFRVLCAQRKGPFGVDALNRRCERVLSASFDLRTERRFYRGRPLLVTQNDPALGLFNGDVGVLDHEREAGGALRTFFPNLERSIAPARLPPFETVFAMTVHKSQGSELDRVLVVLPARASGNTTRELLYTAVSRARRQVILCASEALIRQAVETPIQRASGLCDLLSQES